MRLLFIINTPAQAYTWRYTIQAFLDKGHKIKILARDYGSTPDLIKLFGFEFKTFKPIGSGTWRFLSALGHFQRCYSLSHGFSPSMIIGFGLDAAVTATLLRKPSVVFMDDELTRFQDSVTGLLASSVITPDIFKENLGKKHIRVKSFKEFAYLHPNYYIPDEAIFSRLKIKKDTKYAILRFNAFDAVHDIGKHGFSVADQFNLVREMEKYVQVFISPEGALPRELEGYRLPIPLNRIHDALYYAQLLVTDTQTMATEAAILGTPVVRSNVFVGPNDMSNFIELERKYDLIYSLPKAEQAVVKAIELIKQPDLKERWANKKQNLLKDKIDLTRFMIDFIANYPQSFQNIKQEEVINENGFHNRNASPIHKVRSAFKRTAKNT